LPKSEDGVVYGIDESIVPDLLEANRILLSLVLAKGKPPENGTAGDINSFIFIVEHSGTRSSSKKTEGRLQKPELVYACTKPEISL
jgi:uncharacterized protein (DUF342 family)